LLRRPFNDFAFSSPTLPSRLFPVNRDFPDCPWYFLLDTAATTQRNVILSEAKDLRSQPAPRSQRRKPSSTPNIPAPSAAQDPVPETDLDQDQTAANSDRPCLAFPALAAWSPALPVLAPDR
jgi:hypothetical protein